VLCGGVGGLGFWRPPPNPQTPNPNPQSPIPKSGIYINIKLNNYTS